jgi:hypothetical protein
VPLNPKKLGKTASLSAQPGKFAPNSFREHWQMLASTIEILLIEWSCLAKVILARIGVVVRVFNHGACVRWMRKIVSGRIDPGKRYSKID